jgi:predicted dehydrogenase
MTDPTIGIVGTGFGKTIAQVTKALAPGSEIYLCGSNTEKTKHIAGQIGATGTYDTWQQLIEDSKVDLVVIATPNYLHKEMFALAVNNRKHILLDKPAALTSADVADMQELVKDYPRIIVVNHEARFHPVVQYLKGQIDQGAFGEILTVRLGAYLNLFTDPEYQGSWYNDKSQGGGQVYAIGTHQIDLARYVLGMPNIQSGAIQSKKFNDPRFTKLVTAESQFAAQFVTDVGVSIDVFNDTYCFGYKDLTIEVIGSKGIALYSDSQGLRTSFSNDQPLQQVELSDTLEEVQYGNSLLTKALKFEMQELLRAIETDKSNRSFCTLDVARENLEILERYRV